MKGVRTLTSAARVDLLDKTVDQGCAELGSPVAHESIEDLSAAHADIGIIVVPEWIKLDINLLVGGGYHLHVSNLAVDNRFRQIEFLDHAKRNGSPTGFGIVELSLKQPGADASLGKNFSCAGSARTTSDDGNSQHLSSLRWIVIEKLSPMSTDPGATLAPPLTIDTSLQ